MKPTMLFTIVALTAIILVSSFGLQLAPNDPISVAPDMVGNVLYVCPVASNLWDALASALRPYSYYFILALFFVIMLLLFSWGWALYQNLLTDSFKRETFKKPWQLTKITFWAAIIATIFVMTPNYFRTVHVDGTVTEWVLCDADTPGARAVRADAVHN